MGVTWSLSAGHLCLLNLPSRLSTTGSLLWTWVPTAVHWESWLYFITPCYPEFWFRFICFLGCRKPTFILFLVLSHLHFKKNKRVSLKPGFCQTPCHLPKFSVQEQEVICLFIAGLIKTVMCRELFRRQSMHFDLESQIESHLTVAAPLAAQALENIDRRPTPTSWDLREFPVGQAAL